MIYNVKFSIAVPTYDATRKRVVMGTEAVVENVPGRLHEMMPTLESEIVQANERDRMIRYRMVFRREKNLETYVKSGAIVTITHRLHPQTNGWRTVTTSEQYVVQSDSDVQMTGMDVNLGLVRKDQS